MNKKTLATLPVIVFAAIALPLSGCTSSTVTENVIKETKVDNVKPNEAEPTGEMPDFVDGALDQGTLLATAQSNSWQVDVWQAGTGPIAADAGFLADESNGDLEQGEALIPAGTEMVYLNFQFTNITDKPIGVPVSFGMPDVRSATWDHEAPMPGDFNFEAYEKLGIAMPLVREDLAEEPELPVQPGETIARATSIVYEPGVDSIATMAFPTVDKDGIVDHDDDETVTVAFTIK
ncbi:MAG: hypothetical protein ACK5LO_17450 [Leucobacter sp.]